MRGISPAAPQSFCWWSPGLRPQVIGGTEDLSAGQLIDRTGVLLGLDFPAGKAIDALAQTGEAKPYPVKVREMHFSLSGMQNKAAAMAEKSRENTARFVLECLIYAIEKATEQARKQYGVLPRSLPAGCPPILSCGVELRRRAESSHSGMLNRQRHGHCGADMAGGERLCRMNS